MRHECKNFDFDNGMSENIFSHPCIYYLVSERLRGEEQLLENFEELTFRNALFPWQNPFEKCTIKSELCNGKSHIKKLYTRL